MNQYMSISCKVLNTYTTYFAMYLDFVTYFSLHLYVSTCNNVDQRSFSSDILFFFCLCSNPWFLLSTHYAIIVSKPKKCM